MPTHSKKDENPTIFEVVITYNDHESAENLCAMLHDCGFQNAVVRPHISSPRGFADALKQFNGGN